ncbi:MAG: chromosome segregation protein SMC, partial [Gammaproteobacteria bacterium]|nr:chromosome segregation protein SMC [Gammaproteobacteria bacterium]
MRLNKIKLAGFKSFVDPTSISFPSSLVGVVGPNGCGKSNVIDAVRWVMGESSATRLRGDSITDVIFNGSSSRKPIGLASVELLFDNSETTLEGQYAKYSEISIRREVSRDGISNYYLNGARCRRKDITGVFLGTGLGPRSYSIIEQGMISRMIEAKPEEMRVFLEEAAGISKYKERRKETSNRIKRTKENLSRLMDVLDEVEKQIKHLDRQAKTAERYGQYKNQERRAAADLLALQAKELQDKKNLAATDLAEKKISLESAIADQRRLEASLENARMGQLEKTDDFNAVQSRYYKIGSEISRLEQSIEHAKELFARQQKDLEQAIHGADEITDHIEQDESEIEQLEEKLCELIPGLEQARYREKLSLTSLHEAEDALSEWQKKWNHHQGKYNETQQLKTVEMTRLEQIESRLQVFSDRRNKIESIKDNANLNEIKEYHEEISKKELEKRQQKDVIENQLQDINENILKLRDKNQKIATLVDERYSTLQDSNSKLASLDALQKAALGEGDKSIKSWLEFTGLSKNQKVANKLKVKGSWDKAVETVLGDYLQAVCVTDINPISLMVSKLKNGTVTLLGDQVNDKDLLPPTNSLAEKVSGAPEEIFNILSNVLVADTIEQATKIIKSQKGNISVITIDGVWLSQNWLRVSREKDSKASVLAREQQLRELKSDTREMQARYSSAHKLLQNNKAQLTSLEDQREKLQHNSTSILNEYSEISADLQSVKYKLEQAVLRKSALEEEFRDLDNERSLAEKQLTDSQLVHNKASDLLEQLNIEKVNFEERYETLLQELKRVREQADEDRNNVQDIAIQFESRKSSKQSVTSNLERMKSQLDQLQKRKFEIQDQLNLSQSPLSCNKSDLKKLLNNRLKIESELANSRKLVEEAENKFRNLDQSRLQIDQTVELSRSKVNEVAEALSLENLLPMSAKKL